MKKLLLLVGAVSVAAAYGCSPETVKPSGTPTSLLETVSEASFDDGSGVYKAIFSDGEYSLAISLGTQHGGIAMDIPLPSTGNYSITSPDESNKILEGSSWTDANGTYTISGGSVSVVAGDGSAVFSGSLNDGKGNSFRFKTADVTFEHAAERCVKFSSCSTSSSDGNLALKMLSGNVSCEIVVAVSAGNEDAAVPEGRFSTSDGSVRSVRWLEDGNEAAVREFTVYVSRKAGEYVISGVMSAEGMPGTRMSFDGSISSGSQLSDLSDVICGNWILNADSWYVYDEPSGRWEIRDSYDGQYSMDIIGMDDKSVVMIGGLYEKDFNLLGRISGSSIVTEANPESNPIAHINTTSGGYWLFLTLFDPDIEYLMIWDDVEFSVASDFSSISVVEEVKDFTNSQTGEKRQARYRYLGVIGLDDAGEWVTMFEEWPFIELPVFTRPGFVPSAAERPVRISDSEPLRVNRTISADEIISITPLN